MGQALASLSRNLFSTFICLTLVACNGSYTAFESDAEFDSDIKTADIERDNAELKTLAAFQSAFLGHYQSAAYLFLDASDLPEGASLSENANSPEYTPSTGKPNEFERSCDNDEGTATYGFTRGATELHQVGDQVTVIYDNCREGDRVYNGRLDASYTKIKGLNNRFVNISTSECVESLKGDLSISDADVIFVTADEVRFTRVSDTLRVDVVLIEQEGNIRTEFIKEEYVIESDEKTIVIHQPSTLPIDAVTSVNGDVVYSITNSQQIKENCQYFERTLSASFDNFSTNKEGYLYTSLNGSITLVDAQESENRSNHSIKNSDFQVTVKQGNATEIYSMNDYSVETAVNYSNNTYSYEFDGYINNANVLGGKVQLVFASRRLIGSLASEFPKSGSFEIKGKGFERVILTPDNLNLRFQIDFNGDSTGNGFPDIDLVLNSTWRAFFDREFEE